MEFKDILKKLREDRKMSLEQLAEELRKKYPMNITKSTIYRWENGTEPNARHIQYLSNYFGMSPADMMGMVFEEGSTYSVEQQIPILGTIAAGGPILVDENIIGYAPAPPMVDVNNRVVFFLKIKGDSMNTEFPDGSLVLVDRDAEVRSGDIAAIIIDKEEATVKKVYIQHPVITLLPMSSNASHTPSMYDMRKDRIEICGKVIGAYKSYE